MAGSVRRELKHAPDHVLEALPAALVALAAEPRRARAALDVKKLRSRDAFRLRIGGWRITYTVDDANRIVTLLRAGPRKSAYRP